MQQLPILDGQIRPDEIETEAASLAPHRRRTWYAVLIFCFFAAVIPESIATWSTSVVKVIGNPGDLLFVILFYGLADLLIREAMVRRHLGWVSLILFGVAFGFLNEGVVAGTWYTVDYGGYLYIGQVNYAWAVALTVFHTFISVIIPLAFIETLFPSRAGQSLLRRRGIVISASIFLLLTSLFLFVPSYRPYRLAIFALALVLALIALRLPAARSRILTAAPPPSLWRLRWTGFFASVTYFVLILIVPPITLKLAGPYALAAQYIDIVLFVLFSAFILAIGRGWTARAGWSPRHTLALITGVLVFSILITLLPPVWSTLEPLATLPFLLLLILVNIRLLRRERTRTTTAAANDAGTNTSTITSI